MDKYIIKVHPRGEYILIRPSTLDQLIIKPDIQRNIHPEKINEIIMSQKNDGIRVLDALSLCKFEDKYYLVDGQHRLKALVQLEKEGYPVPDVIGVITYVNSYSEILNYFHHINNREQLSDLYFEDIHGPIKRSIEMITERLEKKYNKAFKISVHPRIPHTNLERIQQAILDSEIFTRLSWMKFPYPEDLFFNEVLRFEKMFIKNHCHSNNMLLCQEKQCFFRLQDAEVLFFKEMLEYYSQYHILDNHQLSKEEKDSSQIEVKNLPQKDLKKDSSQIEIKNLPQKDLKKDSSQIEVKNLPQIKIIKKDSSQTEVKNLPQIKIIKNQNEKGIINKNFSQENLKKDPSQTEVKNDQEGKIPNLHDLREKLWKKYFGNQLIGKCFLCGVKLKKNEYHISHIEAKSLGGSFELKNLQILCEKCNLSMGNKNLYQYGYEKGMLTRKS